MATFLTPSGRVARDGASPGKGLPHGARVVRRLLFLPGMSSQRVVRMAHREYLVEVRLTQAARGLWQAQWSVFRKPLCPVVHGVVTSAHTLRDGAQAAATRAALAWIDTQHVDAAPVTV